MAPNIGQYLKPLRPIITLRDKWGDPTYLIHDAFNPPQPGSGSPTVEYCEVSLALGEPGTIRLIIQDPEKVIDTTRVGLGNQVWVQAKRNADDTPFNLFSGYIKSIEPLRPNYNQLRYVLDGFGSQIVLNERIVNYIRTSLRDPSNPDKPFYEDPNMKLHLLFKELFEKTDILPLAGSPAIKHHHRPGMFNTTDGNIDSEVDTFIASMTEPLVESRQVADTMTDMAGAEWGIIPGSPDKSDSVFLRFPSTIHSGIVIKDKPAVLQDNEIEDYTAAGINLSYILAKAGWSYVDSIKKEDGFSNRLYSKTGSALSSSGSANNDQSTPLAGIDIAQQFTVTSAKLRDLGFTCSVSGLNQAHGNVTFRPTFLDIAVVPDDNNRPGNQYEFIDTVDPSFTQDGVPQQIFMDFRRAGGVNEYDYKFVKPGDKAWVILFARSLYEGQVAGQQCFTPLPDFSVSWHHDGGSRGIHAIRSVCANQSGRTPGANDPGAGWTVQPNSFTYSYQFSDSFSHVMEASDQDSIDKYGLTESFVDASWITDAHTMHAFLASILQYTAKPKRNYKIPKVTIPYNKIFTPGQLVSIIDDKAGLPATKTTIAEVQEVRYEFAADQSGSTPLGAMDCDVNLVGYVDYKEEYIFRNIQMNVSGDLIPLPPPPPVPPTPLPPGSPPPPSPPCPPSTFPPLPPPPTLPPPGTPPPPPGTSSQIGPYPSTGRQLGATTRRAVRHYASGKPDDETIEKNTDDIPYNHYQCVYYVTMHDVEHDDNVSSKLGGTHMGSGWLDHGISFNSGRTCLGNEPNHPNTNSCIKVGPSIGSILEKRIGICTVWRKPTKHTELWYRLPGGNWIKALENTGALGGFTPNNNGNDEAQLRIDGFTDGDDPTIDTAIVQEISPP